MARNDSGVSRETDSQKEDHNARIALLGFLLGVFAAVALFLGVLVAAKLAYYWITSRLQRLRDRRETESISYNI